MNTALSMTAEQIVDLLTQKQILIDEKNGELSLSYPKGALTAELISLIRDNKPQLLEFLSTQVLAEPSTDAQTIMPVPRTEQGIYPVSFAQRRFWFLDKMAGGSTENNMPFALQVSGDFNPEVAQQAIRRIMARHESLRTTMVEHDGEVMQCIHQQADFTLTQVDLRSLSIEAQAIEAQRLLLADNNKVFDLSADYPLRASYLRQSDKAGKPCGILMFNMHHIASDGWSIGLLINEFVAFYQACLNSSLDSLEVDSLELDGIEPEGLAPLSLQYVDYACWQRQWLNDERLSKQLSWWQQQLSDAPVVHSLGLDYPRPAVKSYQGAVVEGMLSQSLSEQLQQLALAQDVTLFMLLHSAIAIVLSRHSGSDDIVIGTPVANRTQTQLEPLIGCFINTLVLRTTVGQTSFGDFLAQVKQVNLAAQAHQDIPFEYLVEHCNVTRTTEHTPLFQIMFTINTNEAGDLTMPGVDFSAVSAGAPVAKFDLEINAQFTAEGISIAWVYDTALFSETRVSQYQAHLHSLLHSLAVQANQLHDLPLAQLTMLSREETDDLLKRFNGPVSAPQFDFSPEQSSATALAHQPLIHQLFEQQAKLTPQAIALQFGTEQLSYQTLNHKSNQLAHHLRTHHLRTLHLQVKDIGSEQHPEILVGLCIERSVDMVVALLAIMKAGAAYLPMDPSYPKDRLTAMIDDSGLHCVVTQSHLHELFNHAADLQLVSVDDNSLQQTLQTYPQDDLNHSLTHQALAYVIYTSGSTGQPKGVMIEHGAMVNFLYGMKQKLAESLSAEAKWLALTTIAFDIAGLELLGPLSFGAQVVLASKDDAINPTRLVQLLQSQQINVMQATPSSWQMLVSDGWQGKHDLLVLSGGEPLPQALAQTLANNNRQLINCYGPTEATVWSMANTVDVKADATKQTALAEPLANYQHYVLDKNLVPVPVGAIGGLYIGGASLARGYLNQPELTAERFIDWRFKADPTSADAASTTRLYQTGDLVRVLPQGGLQFIGRDDEQVKIRGFRIELDEISHHLLKLEPVVACVVRAVDDQQGHPILVAYVEIVPDGTESEAMTNSQLNDYLTAQLRAALPHYMVPSSFIKIANWPLTPNGKVNKKALPEPQMALNHGDNMSDYVAPMGATEQQMTEIWAQLLGVTADKISVKDNFFALGGHSLLAVKLVAKIRSEFNQEIAVSEVFSLADIRALAAALDARVGAGVDNNTPVRPMITAQSRTSEQMPVSFAQQRMWLIDKMAGSSVQYNMPVALQVSGAFDLAAAQTAIGQIIERHESLRTVFAEQEGTVVQVIKPSVDFVLPQQDLSALNAAEQQQKVRQLVKVDSQKSFDLSSDLMIRASYLKLNPQAETGNGILLFNMHHIASDGWSMDILINEFVALYSNSACLPSQSASANQQLAPLTLQYADYAQWQNQWLSGGVLQAQQDYWQQQLADIPAVHGLTLDFTRPEIKSYQGQLVKGQLSAGVSESLKQLARAQDATVFMVLHGALALVLSRHSDGNEMVIGTPVANRMQSELEPLIGCFVNTLVLKTGSHSGQSFNDYLADVREVNLSAQNNQDIPFEHLVELCKVPRSTSYTPLFQIMLTLNISEEEAQLSVPGVQFTPLEPDDMVAKFDLDITIQLSAEGIELYWVYDQALFSKARIETFNRHLETLLCSVAQNPDISLAALSMLSSNEYDYLVHQLNDAQMTMPAISSELLIHQLFEQQVLLVPDKPAVATNDGAAMSYQQLNEASNRLAHYLREQGVGAETLVGLCVGRTANMLIGMLGILKAGGAYVPLDPDYPLARLQYILQDTGLKHLLTESEPAQALDLPQTVQVSRIDALADFATYSAQNPLTLSEQQSSNLAYVIYTSGSTGKPKGVLIEHRQLLTRMQAFIQIVPLTSCDVVPSIASFAFDISLLELVYPLTCGAQIRLISQPDIVDLTQLKAQLADCTFVHMVPSLARAWLEALKSDQAGTDAANSINSSKNKLRYFATGGDKVPRSLLLQLDETLSQTTILQFYGPTEATLFSVCNQHISVDNTTLGRPIDGASLYILKEDNSLAPMGVVGELHIGGAGLARAYLNRPELSGEKFIANPFSTGSDSNDVQARLYKTGDLARYTDDGQLVFVGRSDSQIKIRGFRIEPGEIENCLNQVDDVEEVIVLPDVSENSGGDITGLTAYVKGAKKYPWLAGLTSLKNSLDIKFWPSVGEYPVYDDLIYQGLSQDQYRNDVYLKAYRQHVKDKVVMDIGAGASAIQSLLCVEAGARKVYAVEISEQAANKAQAKIKKLGLEDKITVINGDAAQLNLAEILPEKIDVCTQEVVESIAGAEGIAVIMNGIADNLLANTSNKPLMLPTKAYTMMAAVTLPDHLKHKMALTGKAREYVEKVFAATGKTFDLRMGVTNFPQSHLLSTAGVFEALDFNQRCLIDYSHQQQIEVVKDGVADGLLLWLKLDFSHPVDNEIASDNELDTINGKTSWYPIFVPAFYPNFSLKKGDKLDITCAAQISEDGVHPDYQLEGTIVRGTEQIHSFVYQLPYIGEEINYQFDSSTGQSQSTSDNLFYQQLFSGHYPDSELNESANIVSRLQRIAAEQLPQYMQPSKFVLLEEWPLTPTGKIDSKALMATARNAGQSEYVAPETETQQQLVDIWAQVLAVNSESISIHANFFDIGGHSLLVTNLIHLINSQFSVDLTIREAFSNQVLSECAELIDSMRETHAADVDEAQLAVDEMSDEEVQAMLLALEE